MPKAEFSTNPYKFYLIFITSIFWVIIFFNPKLLPDKYYFDSRVLTSIAQGSLSNFGDKSFGNSARLYDFLNIENSRFLISGFGLTLFTFSLYLAIKFQENQIQKKATLLLYLTCIASIGSVYYSQASKEVVPLAIVMTALWLSLRKVPKKLIVLFLLAAVLFYGSFFRNYWLLTGVIFLAIYFMTKLGVLNERPVLKYTLFSVLLLFTIFLINPQNISAIQSELNRNRIGSEFANTAFLDYPPYLPYWTQPILRLFSFFLPPLTIVNVNLLSLAFGLFLIFSVYCLFAFYKSLNRGSSFSPLLQFVFSHFLTLSIFEPDYGSMTRHVSIFLPVFLTAVLYEVSKASGKPESK